MNPYTKQYDQYKQNAVMTASPETILIMLYSGAINFLLRAKMAIDENNIEDSHKYITKTEKIIRELINSLDMEAGGELAENLSRLYDYLHRQLIKANINKDKAIIDEVLEHLRGLKETWEEAIKCASKEEKENNDEPEEIDRSV